MGPNFRENPISPAEEILAVLIFVFSMSINHPPLYHCQANRGQRSPVGESKRRLLVWNSNTVPLSDRARLVHNMHMWKFPWVQKFMCSHLYSSYFAVLIFAFWLWVMKISCYTVFSLHTQTLKLATELLLPSCLAQIHVHLLWTLFYMYIIFSQLRFSDNRASKSALQTEISTCKCKGTNITL